MKACTVKCIGINILLLVCDTVFVDSSGGLCRGRSETDLADPPEWLNWRHPYLYAWTGGY